MKTAIMQPYVFPYIGYFQLIAAVDVFVFYDDVNFIKRGWINRNSILVNGRAQLLSFPCIKASQNKLIADVAIDPDAKAFRKREKTIRQAYTNAPYFDAVFPLVEAVFAAGHCSISDFAIDSVTRIADYLDMDTRLLRSSEDFAHTRGQGKAERLKTITRALGSRHYINAIGGQKLYTASDFAEDGINLQFLNPGITPYRQFDGDFIPNLSMIDVLMFNSKAQVKAMLADYELGVFEEY